MESLLIQVLGREYRVSVKPEEKETLQVAITMLTERMQQIADKTASSGEALAVMTALNIAHEFVVSQRVPGLDLPGHRRRIASLGETIDQALAKQETLF
jgi:cell division protein ZapA